MNKQEQIEQLKKEPFKIGQEVEFSIPYEKITTEKVKEGKKNVIKQIKTQDFFNSSGIIKDIEDDIFIVRNANSTKIPDSIKYTFEDRYYTVFRVKFDYLSHDLSHCGSDPFVEQDWNARINFYQSDIEQILYRCGWDKREKKFNNEEIGDVIIEELDWNPTIINDKGEEVVYQRPFVWTLQEKQLLLDSIYNNIEIGKFVVRNRAWNWIEKRVKEGKIEHTTFKQIVDGKQRISTIMDFINNKFRDSFGNYWSDLSSKAQRKFYSYRHCTYGELGETATDKDVLGVFMAINHTGAPMSPEHIEFVKNIKL
jgi:hypothetical protein